MCTCAFLSRLQPRGIGVTGGRALVGGAELLAQIEAAMCAWEVGGTIASGLDVASAGPAAFSAGRHFSDLSALPGPVLTTRPLHPTGLAWLGRVMLLGIAPMQAGPICLVVDVSPDQRPDADIPAGLGLPVFIFRTLVAHSNLPYPIWTQVTRRHLGRLHIYLFLNSANTVPRVLGEVGLHRRAGHRLRITVIVANRTALRLWSYVPSYHRILQQGDTRHTVETDLTLKKTAWLRTLDIAVRRAHN